MKRKVTNLLFAMATAVLSVSTIFAVPVTAKAEDGAPVVLFESIPESVTTKTQTNKDILPEAGIAAIIYNEMNNLPAVEIKDITYVQKDVVIIEDEEVPLAATPVINISEEEIEFMEQIVAAESYSYWTTEECLPIAQIIVNRYHSPEFPNTVNEILTQDKQFQTYSNGRYKEVEVTPEVEEAVNRAIRGQEVIPEEALYFCTEEYYNKAGKNGWFGTLTKLDYQVDNTLFFM